MIKLWHLLKRTYYLNNMGRKIKAGPAKTWALPHGEGQGPRPGNHTLPPLKAKLGKTNSVNADKA